MSDDEGDAFQAFSFEFGMYDDPRCRAFHLDLLDQGGMVQATACLHLKQVQKQWGLKPTDDHNGFNNEAPSLEAGRGEDALWAH